MSQDTTYQLGRGSGRLTELDEISALRTLIADLSDSLDDRRAVLANSVALIAGSKAQLASTRRRLV